MVLLRDFRPGMQGVIPVGIIATVGQQPFGLGKFIKQGGSTGVIADLTGRNEEADRATIRIRDGMKLGVHAAFRASNQAARAPFFTRKLEAVRWALR